MNRITRQPRRCACCAEPGHTVMNCNNLLMNDLKQFVYNTIAQLPIENQMIMLGYRTVSILRIIHVILFKKNSKRKKHELIELITEELCILETMVRYFNTTAAATCNIIKIKNIDVYAIQETEYSNKDKEYDCPICLDVYTSNSIYTTNCEHVFCKPCALQHLNASMTKNCPICRTDITELECKYYE